MATQLDEHPPDDWQHRRGQKVNVAESSKHNTTIDVRVTRYLVKRTQLGTSLTPVAIGAGILAKRFPEVVPPSIIFAFYALVLVVILGGVKRLGKRRLHTEAGMVSLGEDLLVRRADVTRWAHDRELARLYGDEQSFALRARIEDAGKLRAQLTQVLGDGHKLQPRGSSIVRRSVLGVALASGLVAIGAIVLHKILLGIFGGVCLIFALAAYVLLSQRVLRL